MTIPSELTVGFRHDANVQWRASLQTALVKHWPTLLVLALAAMFQAGGALSEDVSWLITLCEKTLDGQKPYVDFIEVNPPASILLYLPEVAAARLVGAKAEFFVSLFCFVSIAASLILCARAFGGRAFFEGAGSFGLASLAFALAIFPGDNFAQREHFAVIAGLPLLAVLIARTEGAAVNAGLRTLAGIGAGVMVCIKPHFALIIVAALPFFILRRGWKTTLASYEFYLIFIVCALYAGAVAMFFPAFLHEVAPLVVAVYLPARMSYTALALGAPFAAWLVAGVYLVALARKRIARPLIGIPALASCGAMAGYFIQGKGWSYQAYPAIALMAVALGLTLATDRHGIGRFLSATVLSVAVVVLSALFEATIVIAGVAYGGEEYPRLEAAAKNLGSHLKVLAISSDIAVGHPFTRRIGGLWAQRVASLWITGGARRIIADSGDDPAVISKMRPYLALDRDALVEDIERNRPDIILISNRLGEFRKWAFADPSIAAALKDYRPYASDKQRSGEILLYARSDLVALRPSFDEPAASSSAGR
jgi:hypothetical protein